MNIHRASRALLAVTALFTTMAVAETGGEPALAKAADDAALAWGPCPDFLPAGCGITVLHGDPSKPNADIFLKLPGRSEIPLHTHTSAERMVLVSGELFVTYDGQAEARLTPGTYAYGPAGRPHAGRCASDAPCILMIAFEGPVDAIPAAARS
jgi:mannose-6-phosphate isomerase-like protein (cupin superfamily)